MLDFSFKSQSKTLQDIGMFPRLRWVTYEKREKCSGEGGSFAITVSQITTKYVVFMGDEMQYEAYLTSR